jgi:chaperone modulatory protein CbpM
METSTLLSIDEFCKHYNVPQEFIFTLFENELIEITQHEINENEQGFSKGFIQIEHIKHLEKLIHFHFELDINIAGLDVVTNLLNQINLLQIENLELKNKLHNYNDL